MQGETKADRKCGRKCGQQTAGFSLIELMAVVLIMGILGTVVGVVVGPRIFQARAGTTKTSMQVIQREVEAEYQTKQSYPVSLAVIPTIKKDKDGWGNMFYYKVIENGSHPYMLSSAGPDKEHGTADDISVWTLDDPTN